MKKQINKTALGISVIAALGMVFFGVFENQPGVMPQGAAFPPSQLAPANALPQGQAFPSSPEAAAAQSAGAPASSGYTGGSVGIYSGPLRDLENDYSNENVPVMGPATGGGPVDMGSFTSVSGYGGEDVEGFRGASSDSMGGGF